jgi:uncharacterized protein (DUF58 family)
LAESLFTEQELARLRRLRLAGERVRSSTLRGERRSRQMGSGLEFGAYRPYSHGDDLRRVDWNVYGRLDQLFLKLFEAPGQMRLVLALDASPTLDFGEPNKWRAARRVMAALGLIALATADRVLMARFDDERVQTFEASANEQIFLDAVATLSVGAAATPNAALRSTLSTRGRDTVVLIATDMQSREGVLTLVNECRKHGARSAVISIFAKEEHEPTLEGLTRLQPVLGAQQKLRVDASVLEAYKKELDDYRRAAQSAVRSAGAAYLEIRSDVQIEPIVMELLKSGLLEGHHA